MCLYLLLEIKYHGSNLQRFVFDNAGQFQFFLMNTSIATIATQQAAVAEILSREFIELFKMEPCTNEKHIKIKFNR